MSDIVPYQYQAEAPVRDLQGLKALVTTALPRMQDLLPRHISADRMAKLVLHAASRQPRLFQCTMESIVESVMTASTLGLECDGTRGEGYLIPYRNGKKNRYECRFQTGYQGLAKLARQSGEVTRIEAEVVYENDFFTYQKGARFDLVFRPALRQRGIPIGAYSLVEFKDGGLQAEWMDVDEIEKVRRVSRAGDESDAPWKQWWDQMARKTVFRRLAKWLNLSSEKAELFQKALEADAVFDIPDDTPPAPEPAKPRARLAEKLHEVKEKRKAAPPPQIHDDLPIEADVEELPGDPPSVMPISAPAEPAAEDDDEVLYDTPEAETPDVVAQRLQAVGIKCSEAALVAPGVVHAALSLIIGRAIGSRKEILAADMDRLMPVLLHAGRRARTDKDRMAAAWEALALQDRTITTEAIDRAMEAVSAAERQPAARAARKPADKTESKGEMSRRLYGNND